MRALVDDDDDGEKDGVALSVNELSSLVLTRLLTVDVANIRDAWLAARADAHAAYSDWCEASADRRREASAAYRAAEEREAHAAAVLAHVLRTPNASHYLEAQHRRR